MNSRAAHTILVICNAWLLIRSMSDMLKKSHRVVCVYLSLLQNVCQSTTGSFQSQPHMLSESFELESKMVKSWCHVALPA